MRDEQPPRPRAASPSSAYDRARLADKPSHPSYDVTLEGERALAAATAAGLNKATSEALRFRVTVETNGRIDPGTPPRTLGALRACGIVELGTYKLTAHGLRVHYVLVGGEPGALEAPLRESVEATMPASERRPVVKSETEIAAVEPGSDDVFALGVERGETTGRTEPSDRDLDWLARRTDGRVQTDPAEIATFAGGMRDGCYISLLLQDIAPGGSGQVYGMTIERSDDGDNFRESAPAMAERDPWIDMAEMTHRIAGRDRRDTIPAAPPYEADPMAETKAIEADLASDDPARVQDAYRRLSELDADPAGERARRGMGVAMGERWAIPADYDPDPVAEARGALREAQDELDGLERDFRGYDVGDRPMSPPARLFTEIREARERRDRAKYALDLAVKLAETWPNEKPRAVVMYCPACGYRHIDRGILAHIEHNKHLCHACGAEFTVLGRWFGSPEIGPPMYIARTFPDRRGALDAAARDLPSMAVARLEEAQADIGKTVDMPEPDGRGVVVSVERGVVTVRFERAGHTGFKGFTVSEYLDARVIVPPAVVTACASCGGDHPSAEPPAVPAVLTVGEQKEIDRSAKGLREEHAEALDRSNAATREGRPEAGSSRAATVSLRKMLDREEAETKPEPLTAANVAKAAGQIRAMRGTPSHVTYPGAPGHLPAHGRAAVARVLGSDAETAAAALGLRVGTWEAVGASAALEALARGLRGSLGAPDSSLAPEIRRAPRIRPGKR